MKKSCCFLVALLIAVQLFPISVKADGWADPDLHTGKGLHTEAYSGTAKAVFLYEMNTDTVLYAHNPDMQVNPTGILKLLTALIAIEEGNMEDVVTVRRSTLNSVGVGVVSASLQAGEEITLQDLLCCIMVSSANDACAVVAEHIAGSQADFIKKMNDRAAELGCGNTHFTNVHGLMDEKQHSTARDLAIIVTEAMKNPEFVRLFGLKKYTVPATNMSGARNLNTTNYMMNPDSPYYDARVTGGKPAAATTRDRSLVCTAEMDGGNYLCVVMSAQAKVSGNSVTSFTNFKEGEKLLDLGFDGFTIQQVLGAGQPYDQYPVKDGENHVVVAAEGDVHALLPVKFQQSQLSYRAVRDEAALVAPLQSGARVGRLEIYYGDILIGQTDLLAQHDVALKGTSIQDVEKDVSTQKGGSLILRFLLAGLGVVVIAAGVLFVKVKYFTRSQGKTAERSRKK